MKQLGIFASHQKSTSEATRYWFSSETVASLYLLYLSCHSGPRGQPIRIEPPNLSADGFLHPRAPPTSSSADWFADSVHRVIASPICQVADSRVRRLACPRDRRFTDSPLRRFAGSPVRRFTNSPVHRFAGSPICRFTDPILGFVDAPESWINRLVHSSLCRIVDLQDH